MHSLSVSLCMAKFLSSMQLIRSSRPIKKVCSSIRIRPRSQNSRLWHNYGKKYNRLYQIPELNIASWTWGSWENPFHKGGTSRAWEVTHNEWDGKRGSSNFAQPLNTKCCYRSRRTMCIRILKLSDVDYVQHQIITSQAQLWLNGKSIANLSSIVLSH